MARIVRGLVEGHPDRWEEMIPYARGFLRITPAQSLGGRSPYHVVTGMKPAMPRLLTHGLLRVQSQSVDDYVQDLLGYLKTCHQEVHWHQDEHRQEQELETAGHLAYELEVGDYCALAEPQTESSHRRTGPRKFMERTRPEVKVVVQKLGANTVE